MDRIFSARLDERTLQELEQVTRRLGMTKKRFLEEAIRMRAKEIGAQAGTDVWTETLGAWKRREAPQETVAAARKAFRESFERHHRRSRARIPG